MAYGCITHHYACNCREAEFAAIKAERDALRQRIRSAPVVDVTACNQVPGASDFDYGQLSAAFAKFKIGKRVHLA